MICHFLCLREIAILCSAYSHLSIRPIGFWFSSVKEEPTLKLRAGSDIVTLMCEESLYLGLGVLSLVALPLPCDQQEEEARAEHQSVRSDTEDNAGGGDLKQFVGEGQNAFSLRCMVLSRIC